MNWSIERLICDATRFAKAVVAPVFTPPMDCWPRTDAYRASLGADQLADAEEQQEVWEAHDLTSFAEMQERLWAEREAEEEAAEPKGRIPWVITYENVRRIVREELADTPNPTEPSLSDDELVAVRGLIDERYNLKPASPDWLRNMVCATIKWARDCGASWEQIDEWVGDTNFAGAAASLAADGGSSDRASSPQQPSAVREDKQRDASTRACWISAVDPQPKRAASPRAASPGSASEESAHSPSASEPEPGHPNLEFPDPSEMHMWPDWLLMTHAANCLTWPKHEQLVDELRKRAQLAEHGASPAAAGLSFINWAIPAICDVLANHTPSHGRPGIDCGPDWVDWTEPDHAEHMQHFTDWQDWREHVAPLIAERLETALLASDFNM